MTTLTFKATPEDAQRIRRAARARKMTLSEYARTMLLPKPASHAARKTSVKPGNVYIAPAQDAPVLTDEMVKAALYDL